MTYNIVHKWPSPQEPYPCDIVDVNIKLIPTMLHALQFRSSKYWWDTPEDEKQGRKLLAEQGARLLMPCGQEIVNALHLLYMQQDGIHNGVNYSYEVDDETGNILFNPPIPIVPPNSALYTEPGTRWRLEDLRDLLFTHITGAATADYTTTEATNPLLVQIRDALAAESEEEQLEVLRSILLALGGAL